MTLTVLGRRVAGGLLCLAAPLQAAPLQADSLQAQGGTSVQPTAPNQADSEDLAQQRFREATEAYRNERYSAAASLFEAADRLAPHASNRFNAAAAWEQAGELARAATGYQAALAQGAVDGELGKARRLTAMERLGALRTSLGHVNVDTPLGALLTVDHIQRLALPARFYLQPGNYQFDLEFRGQTLHHSELVVAGAVTTVDFGIAPPSPEPPPPSPPPPPEASPATSSGPGAWTWVALGAGLALTGVAANFGFQANAAENVYNRDLTLENYQSARNLERKANIAWAGAATAGVAGVILMLATPTVEF